jgi:hypothetical protein
MTKGLAMSKTARTIVVGCTLAWTMSCGGAPPAPVAAPPVAPPPPAPALVAAADVSDATEPTYLVGIVRWKSPQATIDTINRWTGLRVPSSTLAAELLDKGLAEILAYDAPVDAVVALDPKANDFAPFTAVSVGVRSLEEARRAAQAMGSVTEVRPGEYKVSLHRGKRRGDRPFCILGAAVGAAPARVVCGSREREVNALSAYMTHTLPMRNLGSSDLHVELHAPPAMQLYGTMLSSLLRGGTIASRSKLEIGEPAFDRAVDAAASGVSEELIALANDLDTLTIDASVAPDQAGANVALRMKGQQSWTASTLASEATRAAAPPSMFWRLPANSAMASYQYQADTHRFDAIRHTLSDLLDGWLAHEGIPLTDRAPLTAVLSDKYTSDSPWVSASGPFASSDQPASKKAAPAAADAVQGAIDSGGWYLIGIGAPNQVADAMKSLATGINRPKIQALVRSKLASLDSSKDAAQVVKPGTPVLTLKSLPAPKELRKGSLDFELAIARDVVRGAPTAESVKVAKAKAPPLAPLKMHVIVVPEGGQTWVALGGDRAQLIKTMLGSMEGAPESGTLATRQDLGTLKNGKFVAGSFLTIESFLDSWVNVIVSRDEDAARKMRETRSMLSATPNKGKTPLLVTAEVAPTDGMTYTLRLDVPKGYIEDVIVLVASLSMSGLARP